MAPFVQFAKLVAKLLHRSRFGKSAFAGQDFELVAEFLDEFLSCLENLLVAFIRDCVGLRAVLLDTRLGFGWGDLGTARRWFRPRGSSSTRTS